MALNHDPRSVPHGRTARREAVQVDREEGTDREGDTEEGDGGLGTGQAHRR